MDGPTSSPPDERPQPVAQRRFVLAFVGTTLLGLALIAGLNCLIDPYGAVGITLVPADSRTGDSRTARGELLQRFTGETVLIGSSRTRVGYDGSLRGISGGPACNVGLDGTHLRELSQVVDEAVRNPRVRRIVLSLDLHLCASDWQPNADYRCSRFNPERTELEHWCDLLWNGRTIEASLRALKRNWRGEPPRHDALGFAQGAAIKFESAAQSVRTTAALQQLCGAGGLLDGLQSRAETRQQLTSMLATCRQRGIRLTIVIDPVHALLLEAIRQRGDWSAYQAWKDTLVAVAANDGVPVWDFTGYDAYCTEPLLSDDAPAAAWFWEPSHMRRELGDRVLRRICGDPAADATFGVQLTPENMPAHWAGIESGRRRWLTQHPVESSALANLIAPETTLGAPAKVAGDASAPSLR